MSGKVNVKIRIHNEILARRTMDLTYDKRNIFPSQIIPFLVGKIGRYIKNFNKDKAYKTAGELLWINITLSYDNEILLDQWFSKVPVSWAKRKVRSVSKIFLTEVDDQKLWG